MLKCLALGHVLNCLIPIHCTPNFLEIVVLFFHLCLLSGHFLQRFCTNIFHVLLFFYQLSIMLCVTVVILLPNLQFLILLTTTTFLSYIITCKNCRLCKN